MIEQFPDRPFVVLGFSLGAHVALAIGHELAKRARYGEPWGIVYRLTGSRVDCSIYSLGDCDASAIATTG